MNDMELAEEIERGLTGSDYLAYTLKASEWQQIIAALRRSEPTREAAHQMRQTISHAVARGWCTPANSHKEMDTALAAAIVDEVICAIKASPERPPSGEMVMVPRELIDRALLWFHTLAENGMDATFSDGERTPNAVAMDDIAAQFSALKDRA